ncbi:hypothetical protein ACFE04_000209 [Oxalis oulophora]
MKSKKTSITKPLLGTIISSIFRPPLQPSIDPKYVFNGNFAPVDEMDPTECVVIEGELPISLNGVYIRNGSNPQKKINGAQIFFEGDGMLHSLRFSNGNVIYCSRFVKTYKYLVEKEAGAPIIPQFLSGFYGLEDVFRFVIISLWRSLIGKIDLKRGIGTANTSVSCFANKILALGESDLPYIVNVTQEGNIETIKRWDFNKKLFANMTAHPKICFDTKEAFVFECNPFSSHMTYFWFDKNGVKQKGVPVSYSTKNQTFVHDFAITKRFAIFPESQFVFRPFQQMLGRGMSLSVDKNKVPRLGIINRYANSSDKHIVKWFVVPGFNALHVVNAWELSGEDAIIFVAPNNLPLEQVLNATDKVQYTLEKSKINLQTGEVSRKILSKSNLELGCINPYYLGKRSRYVYMGVNEKCPKMSGLTKIDLEKECEVGRSFYGDNCFGGEPCFVPRNANDDDNIDYEEDDGFVVTFVHDEKSGESKFLVMDAKSPELDIVAAVRIPRRVPYGLHGTFISQKNMLNLSIQ